MRNEKASAQQIIVYSTIKRSRDKSTKIQLKRRRKMKKPRGDLGVFTIQEILKATGLVEYQIPVTFKCDISIKAQAEKNNTYSECICYIELVEQKGSETRTVIGEFKETKGKTLEQRKWIPKEDNIIARIAKMKQKHQEELIKDTPI